MPPRASSTRASGRGGPTSRGGSSRGGGPLRGGGPSRGGLSSDAAAAPSASAHITTVGVKRTAYGTSGVPKVVLTNHFPVSIPQAVISHYDVITPSEKTLPARLNMDLITHLQNVVAPDVFTPKVVYDGRKNIFCASTLKFPNGENSCEFDVSLADTRTPDVQRTGDAGRGPKIYKIKLNKVAEINPVVLERFLEGKQSHDNDVLTAITALNVVIRMEPTLKYPFNVRSFFTNQEKMEIGLGIELWRGYFQSVRPAIGRMLINIDISTGTMYKPGPLINLCLEYVKKVGIPHALAPKRGFPERERLRLQRFISGIRVHTVQTSDTGRGARMPRVVKKISAKGAADLEFRMREGGTMTVAAYFKGVMNKPLQFPDLPCVEVGSGALIPLELCTVPEGQIMRKQVPAELTKNVLEFATKPPQERLRSIKNGLGVLAYGQSEYVRQFGMKLESLEPLKVNARQLPPPTLNYGKGSKVTQVTPRDGSWNMVGKRFYRPAAITGWVVVIYGGQQRFNSSAADNMVNGLLTSFDEVGIRCDDKKPLIKWENAQGNIIAQLKSAGAEYRDVRKILPNLIVAVLPEGSTDIYTSIKHFGDCLTGVATQCLKVNKCYKAKPQYYANVCLKINVKLGGINTVPDPASVRYLADPANPTIVMGADVIHPAPGSEGRPSFTSVVGNVDSDTSKYIATTRVQESRREMIDDLEDMSAHILDMYMKYRKNVEKKAQMQPRRIIFYRDGVSEGQFAQVLEYEVPKLRAACERLNITPKITVIVVGKRHHVRFFPERATEGDRSGNCLAGTVVDRDVTNPTENDFYLQSHGGLLGTSRPAHYNVLLDENNFTPDGLQQLSFALCHVYARSTRSVSIPAPVYYADIVCSRARNHFDPQATDGIHFSESASASDDQQQVTTTLEAYKKAFKDLHKNAALSMYFS